MNINESIKLINGAREDIKNHWSGNCDAREAADQQLSAALGYLNSQSDDDQLQESISDARTTIGTFFDDLRSITNETYGSVRDQLQAGEGNTQP
jgi:hypothetical protein